MDKSTVLWRIDALERMLHDLRNDILADDRPTEETVKVSERQGTWSLSKLEALYPRVEHLTGVMALLDITAERAPQAVPYQEVLRRSGLSDQEQRSDHTRLSWATKELFEGKKRWPLDWQQPANGELQYRMPAKVAQWWRDIRQREHPGSSA